LSLRRNPYVSHGPGGAPIMPSMRHTMQIMRMLKIEFRKIDRILRIIDHPWERGMVCNCTISETKSRAKYDGRKGGLSSSILNSQVFKLLSTYCIAHVCIEAAKHHKQLLLLRGRSSLHVLQSCQSAIPIPTLLTSQPSLPFVSYSITSSTLLLSSSRS
jgi:hypothetical protein